MHGDARRPEDQQQNGDVHDAGRVPGRSEDARRVPQSGALQVNTPTSTHLVLLNTKYINITYTIQHAGILKTNEEKKTRR